MLKTIVMTTYYKNEKYIDQCIKVLNIFWKGHPDIYVVGEKGHFKHSKKYSVDTSDWSVRLAQGLNFLARDGILRDGDYLLLLNEDHVPLLPISNEKIEKIAKYMKINKIAFVSLSGYGRDKLESKIDDIEIYAQSEYMEFYAELQPSIWEFNHLLCIVSKACQERISDPWRFEYIKDTEMHFTSIYAYSGKGIWPSRLEGFMNKGRVSLNSVFAMKNPIFSKLRLRLILDFLYDLPSYIACWVKKKLRSIMARIKKWKFFMLA